MFGREPVLWLTLINSLILLGVGFGLKVTTEQIALIMTAVNAVIGFYMRSQVTPNVRM